MVSTRKERERDKRIWWWLWLLLFVWLSCTAFRFDPRWWMVVLCCCFFEEALGLFDLPISWEEVERLKKANRDRLAMDYNLIVWPQLRTASVPPNKTNKLKPHGLTSDIGWEQKALRHWDNIFGECRTTICLCDIYSTTLSLKQCMVPLRTWINKTQDTIFFHKSRREIGYVGVIAHDVCVCKWKERVWW